MKSHRLAIQIGATIGIIGLFVMGANTWAGIAVVLVGAAIVGLSFWTPGNTSEEVVHSPRQNRRQVTNSREHGSSLNPRSLSLLKRTLYQANLDPRAPVLTGDNNKVLLTVQEILVKMVEIAETHGIATPELAKDITKIYPRIFDHIEQARARYPADPDRLALWLADRSLKDVRKELEVRT